MTVRGFPEWRARLHEILHAMDRANFAATREANLRFEREGKLMLRRKTHPPGTPTPSLPGEPPALVTGHLARSWTTRGPVQTGPHEVRASNGPTAVYSRAQELGRETPTRLPRRPYVRPSAAIAQREVRGIYERHFRTVILS